MERQCVLRWWQHHSWPARWRPCAGAARARRFSDTMATVVATRGLCKRYESEAAPVRALRGVDLIVEEGEFVAVTGPSGCGKSTLLALVAGLDRPTGGEGVLAGESLAGKDESELARFRRSHVGLLFPFFNLLYR